MPSASKPGSAAGGAGGLHRLGCGGATALIKPKIIVCLGRVAACRLISPEFKVTREHGQFIEKNGVWMMGTLHPAAVLRVPRQKTGMV